jgi:hypothetical protein
LYSNYNLPGPQDFIEGFNQGIQILCQELASLSLHDIKFPPAEFTSEEEGINNYNYN